MKKSRERLLPKGPGVQFQNMLMYILIASRRGAYDSVTDSSVLSNPADTQNVSCLGHCGWDICPKTLYLKWAEPSVLGALKELISWRQ